MSTHFKAIEKLLDRADTRCDGSGSGEEFTATIFQDPGRGDIYINIDGRRICLHPDGSASYSREEWSKVE